MIIPRLPEATSSIDVTITVGKKLRPYFTEWYQRTKLDGESPQNFVNRILKEQALSYYLRAAAGQIIDSHAAAVSADATIFESEVLD